MKELTGSNWRVFAARGDTLSDKLQDAANAVAGIKLLHPTATIRVYHAIEINEHEVYVITEGD